MLPALVLCLLAAGPDGPADEVLAEAGGERITRGRAALFLTLAKVPRDRWADRWDWAVGELEERAVMRRYLAARRATPEASILERAVARREADLGENPAAKLAELGVTADDLAAEAALPKAWEVQARRLITPDRLRDHFEANRRRYDGTALTVAHVFRPGDATDELAALRARIEAGELTFAEAAERFSAAKESGATGGVIGPVRFGDGRVPPAVSEAAFALKDGEISDPVRSSVGTHLVTVTGVAEPGELVLEDVRRRVRDDLKAELWDETLSGLR